MKNKKNGNTHKSTVNKVTSVSGVSKENGTHAEKKGFFAEDTREKITYLESVDDKQFWMYDWCEAKVGTLATIDTILLAILSFIFEKLKESSYPCKLFEIIQTVLMFVTLISLSVSLIIALLHIRPKMGKTSNKGRPNHRSSNGIRHWSNKESYYEAYDDLTCELICKDLAYQIYGMNVNIWKNQKTIKVAVTLDIISVIGFLLFVFILYGSPYVAKLVKL